MSRAPVTGLRVKRSETGESRPGWRGWGGGDSVPATAGGAGGGSPARTPTAPPGPPCPSAPLGRKPGGGEHCGEPSGTIPGRPRNVPQSVGLPGEEERHALLAHGPFSRERAHTYTHADRPRDAGTRGGKGASPPACATAVRAQTPGVRTGPRPRRATRSGGGEGVGGVRGPKTARGIIGFLMGRLSSCKVGENQKGAERWLARLWIGVGCVHVELREIRQWE